LLNFRYHPAVKELKEKIFQKEKSGGILFNLGIHYLDLLLYLFGPAQKIKTNFLTETKGEGIIEGKNYLCQWRLTTEEEKEKQKRVFEINGASYNFSSTENLYIYVYKDMLEGKGITPKEALKSIELIEKICASYKK
jgi:UDP-N-acetyl-2-amino-2-deoxyglucuronate dehydrogenase